MLLAEPQPTRWDFHWGMYGGAFRIRPIFWASCVLPGVVYYQAPNLDGVAAFFFWVFAVLVSLLAHELGHVFAARLFGARPRIVLSGLGGHVFGLEEMKRWKRVLVALAGPLMNGLLFALLWNVTAYPLPKELGEWWLNSLGNGMAMLMMMNAIWGLLNLLPLWPLDGGRIAVELGDALLGRRGQTLALLLSLAVCLLLTGYVTLWQRVTRFFYEYDMAYRVYLEYYAIQAMYCYAFWLSAFRALWGDATPPDELAKSERAA